MDEPIYGIPPDLIVGPSADYLPLAGEANWGMAAFQVDRLRALTDGGAGVIVGIVDTGVDRNHSLLANCFDAADFTNSRVGPNDSHGHGTHCTGTVGATDPRIGVANRIRTVHGKGLGDSGSGGSNQITAAMRYCISKGAEIISMSLGSSGEDPSITGLIRELAEQGVWVVCAGGNSGVNTPDVDWPARSPYCISVAALGPDMTPANFSNSGAKIDTSGAGVQIWSTRPGGGFQQMSGTSMACPFTAGMLGDYRAGLKQRNRPIPKVDELRAKLFARSTDIGPPGDDRRTGPGWATPLLLALDLAPDPSPVA